MAVIEEHRMDKEAREFSKNLVGKRGFVRFAPIPPPQEAEPSPEPKKDDPEDADPEIS